MRLPFSETKAIESQIDQFLDILIKGVLTMREALQYYLEGNDEDFVDRIEKVRVLENQADDIRMNTETTLYTYALIPESRGDVLDILERMDNVIDRVKEVLQRFSVERPNISEEYQGTFHKLTESTVNAVDNVVGAARAYFREVDTVRDYINKVGHYESEADRHALQLKKQIFNSDMRLAEKMHLRYFIEQVESISDIAENVGDALAIAAIKRSL